MSELTAGFARLGRGAFLRITGEDATRWLNGMVTNSVQGLGPGQGNYNFLLNAQGRIQGDCNIYREPGDGPAVFVLETSAEQLDAIEALLDKFIIMDDVVLERWNPATQSLALLDSDASEGLVILGSEAENTLTNHITDQYERRLENAPATGTMIYGRVNGSPVAIFAAPMTGVPCFEVWMPDTKESDLLQESLFASGLGRYSSEELEALRVKAGTPKFGVDIRDKDLPQETNQTQALHFNKGCYLGQEIVERIRSRGQVHRLFFKLTLEGAVPEALPAAIESEGKAVGEITSVAPVDGKLLALGYVRREFVELKKPLTYAGGAVAVRQ